MLHKYCKMVRVTLWIVTKQLNKSVGPSFTFTFAFWPTGSDLWPCMRPCLNLGSNFFDKLALKIFWKKISQKRKIFNFRGSSEFESYSVLVNIVFLKARIFSNFLIRYKNKIEDNNEKIVDRAIHFPTNWFHRMRSLHRPPASLGVKINLKTI